MSRRQRCSRGLKAAFWCLFPHVFLICCLVLYGCTGALIFQHLERSNSPNSTASAPDLLQQLWGLSRNHSLMNDFESFRKVSGRLIDEFRNNEFEWNFLSSLFFCCTVFTTVGYGHMTPDTTAGKLLCMVYGVFGIPLMLLVLADLGDILAGYLSRRYRSLRECWLRCFQCRSEEPNPFSSLKNPSQKSSCELNLDGRVSIKEPLNLSDVLKSQAAVRRQYLKIRNIEIFEQIIIRENQTVLPFKCPYKKCHSCPELDKIPSTQSAFSNFDKLGEELDKLDVPFVIILFVVVTYILLGAVILLQWEDWDTLDAFYFCFVTLTTIGFGDIFPKHPNFFLLLSVYTVIGMAIMCMAFKLVQNRLVALYKRCMMCISGGNVTMNPS